MRASRAETRRARWRCTAPASGSEQREVVCGRPCGRRLLSSLVRSVTVDFRSHRLTLVLPPPTTCRASRGRQHRTSATAARPERSSDPSTGSPLSLCAQTALCRISARQQSTRSITRPSPRTPTTKVISADLPVPQTDAPPVPAPDRRSQHALPDQPGSSSRLGQHGAVPEPICERGESRADERAGVRAVRGARSTGSGEGGGELHYELPGVEGVEGRHAGWRCACS